LNLAARHHREPRAGRQDRAARSSEIINGAEIRNALEVVYGRREGDAAAVRSLAASPRRVDRFG